MSDYSGQKVDLEVARYGLRTFRPARKGGTSNPYYDDLIAGMLIPYSAGLGVKPQPIDAETHVLGSVYIGGGQYWTDGTCTAECHNDKAKVFTPLDWLSWLTGQKLPLHQAPSEGCGCGIYATLTYEHLADQYPKETRRVVTVVAAEGQTIIGDKGFRTQYARVVAYWCDDGLLDICKTQFKDAERFPKVNHMLKAYGFLSSAPSWGFLETFKGLLRDFGLLSDD
jgi:hypothetical protein